MIYPKSLQLFGIMLWFCLKPRGGRWNGVGAWFRAC
jgi:hypothetical protein